MENQSLGKIRELKLKSILPFIEKSEGCTELVDPKKYGEKQVAETSDQEPKKAAKFPPV
jgi:hypothetical protein